VLRCLCNRPIHVLKCSRKPSARLVAGRGSCRQPCCPPLPVNREVAGTAALKLMHQLQLCSLMLSCVSVRLWVLRVVVSSDDLSRQALMAQAEDLAVEDCLLVLEKALLQGKLTPEAYMKQVRRGVCFCATKPY